MTSVTLICGAEGGAKTFCEYLKKGLSRNGVKADIESLYDLNSRRIDLSSIRRIALKDSNILHLNSILTLKLIRSLTKYRKASLVYTIHGIPDPCIENDIVSRMAYHLEHIALRSRHELDNSNITCLSQYNKGIVRTRYEVDPIVIYPGIDLPEEQICRKARIRFRSELNIPQYSPVFLWVGRFHPIKDPFTFIKASHVSNKKFPKHTSPYFVMVGGPNNYLFSECKEYISSRPDLKPRFKFLGKLPRSKMHLVYSGCDFLVQTSLRESCGFVGLEAMTYRLPIISTAAGAIPEILGSAPIYYRKRDHAVLAHRMLDLSFDEKKIETMKNRSSRRAKMFSLEKMAENYIRVYEGCG